MKLFLTTATGEQESADSIEDMESVVEDYINSGEVIDSIIDENGKDYKFTVLVKIEVEEDEEEEED